MSDNQNSLECNAICWGIAAVVGLVAMVMLYMLADFGALQAIFTGGLLGTLLGLVLSIFVCRGQKAAHDLAAEEKPAQRYAREADEDRARREGTPMAAPASASASAATGANPNPSFAMKPSQDLPGQAELSERKGEWSYGADNTTPSSFASVPDADAPAAPAPEPKKPAAKKKAAPAKKAEAAPAAAGDAPTLYTSASEGAADDLKLISGVGPKLEQTLNEMGIWYFKQVAAWGPSDIAWVDDRLRFKGRIERDDWMSQAKILAEGGETEFSKKKKK
ncbi:hypothetical protein [uncultured Sulfitobacter sp.]|uniref:hypothetical protein n=1 Tax=uncultured Sulfitobacter sp. TaxID=191468 RepID=UPI00262D3727|nr:hypothetical protein [uncultured Sulfitobacter sp.]